jgi:hypothetical protein
MFNGLTRWWAPLLLAWTRLVSVAALVALWRRWFALARIAAVSRSHSSLSGSAWRNIPTPIPTAGITINAADPLNLIGILTSGVRVPAITANRILLRDGLPIAALIAGEIKQLHESGNPEAPEIQHALIIGKMPPALRAYYS